MTTLEISQIIFNLVVSIAVIIITILFCILAFDTIKMVKLIKKFANDLSKESAELYEKIAKFIAGIFSLRFISKFFDKKKKNK